jgi:hypothetical protein
MVQMCESQPPDHTSEVTGSRVAMDQHDVISFNNSCSISFSLTLTLCAAIMVPCYTTWHLLVYAVLQLSLPMLVELDFVSMGRLHTKGGDMTIWQVFDTTSTRITL